MTFRVVLVLDLEANSYSAVSPVLSGCASAGETKSEARANIWKAFWLYLSPAEVDLPVRRLLRSGSDERGNSR